MDNARLKKTAAVLLLVLVGLFSCFFLADRLSAPELYARYIVSIEDKTETVLRLTATATLASAGISAIPGDMATPIAAKLADFSEYFLLILCVLYSEKYLLTIIPLVACRYLVPLICGVFAVGRVKLNKAVDRLGFKLVLLTLGVALIIPMSLGVSDLIYDTYRQSIDQTITEAEALTDETAALAEAETGGISAILNRLSETVESLTHKASNILNRFVETLAVLIVTSCILPLIVLLFFFWIFKRVAGVDLREFSWRREDRR